MEQTEKKLKEESNTAQQILKRVKENKDSIHINRAPMKTKESFERLAHEEFCDDFGMTLKWLMDDLISNDSKLLIAKINEQEMRIIALEDEAGRVNGAKETPETVDELKKPIMKKMVDGTVRRVG